MSNGYRGRDKKAFTYISIPQLRAFGPLTLVALVSRQYARIQGTLCYKHNPTPASPLPVHDLALYHRFVKKVILIKTRSSDVLKVNR